MADRLVRASGLGVILLLVLALVGACGSLSSDPQVASRPSSEPTLVAPPMPSESTVGSSPTNRTTPKPTTKSATPTNSPNPGPSETEKPSQKPSPKPSTTPKSKPEPKPAIQQVPAAQPTKLAIPALGLPVAQVSVQPLKSAVVNGTWVINPPESTVADLQDVWWWNERPAPGTLSGTVYMYGHSCRHANTWCVFQHLGQLSVGNKITVTTPKGVLTYRVTSKLELDHTAGGVGSSQLYSQSVNGRLVLMTCAWSGENVVNGNWAIVAQLVSAQKS